MICFGGREIAEIYLGDMPIFSLYIGGRLVWESFKYRATGAVTLNLPQSDAETLKSHGITYSEESALIPGTVFAKPYMRHIAPMLAENPLTGSAEVFMKIAQPELSELSENVLTPHAVRGAAARGADTTSEHIGTGIHEGNMIPAPGSSMPFTSVSDPVSEANITGGYGEAPRDAYISDGMHSVPLTLGGDEAAGIRHGGAAEYAVRVMYASGRSDALKRSPALSVQAVGKALKADADFLKGTAEWLTFAKAKAEYSGAEKYSAGDRTIHALAAASGGKSKSKSFSTVGAGIPSERAAAKVGKGAKTDASGILPGTCSASMTTELYEEPKPTAFDTMPVADIDMLTVAVIDTMSIA